MEEIIDLIATDSAASMFDEPENEATSELESEEETEPTEEPEE